MERPTGASRGECAKVAFGYGGNEAESGKRNPSNLAGGLLRHAHDDAGSDHADYPPVRRLSQQLAPHGTFRSPGSAAVSHLDASRPHGTPPRRQPPGFP